MIGTVAGTVINTFFYNSWDATYVAAKPTDNDTEEKEIDTDEPTNTTKGLDPLIGGATSGIVGTNEVHWIGCGKTCACVAIDTELTDNGKNCTAAIESLHSANKVRSTEKTVESYKDKRTDGTIDSWDELDCEGTCTATES